MYMGSDFLPEIPANNIMTLPPFAFVTSFVHFLQRNININLSKGTWIYSLQDLPFFDVIVFIFTATIIFLVIMRYNEFFFFTSAKIKALFRFLIKSTHQNNPGNVAVS